MQQSIVLDMSKKALFMTWVSGMYGAYYSNQQPEAKAWDYHTCHFFVGSIIPRVEEDQLIFFTVLAVNTWRS